MEELKKSDKPSYVGPGVWFLLTALAKRATDVKGKTAFASAVHATASEFRCGKCREHIQDYVAKNPVEYSFTTEKGCFRWMFDFHNVANVHAKKSLVKWSDAVGYWYDTEPCEQDDCDSPQEHAPLSTFKICERKHVD